MASLSPNTQVAIDLRVRLGLESGVEYVLAVEDDPDSVVRHGISVTIAEAALLDDRDLTEAIELRRLFGLEADPAWVRSVLADPMATMRGDGILMSPEEAAAWDHREQVESAIRPAVRWYGAQHPDEFAGLWFPETGPAVVQFTGHIERHRAALAALIPPGTGEFEVRQVSFTLDELDAYYEQIRADWRWFEEEGMRLEDNTPNVRTNRVEIEVTVKQPQPFAAERIRDRFAAGEWLSIDLQADPKASLPFAAGLVATIRSTTGAAVSGLVCELRAGIPGAAGENVFRSSDRQGRCTWNPGEVRATKYALIVREEVGGTILGQTGVTLKADRGLRATIPVHP
jgi:hypothetical protein